MTVPVILCSIDPVGPTSDSRDLLVLGPSLGTTADLWRPAVAALRAGGVDAVRILRFDLPGHGASPVAREPFSMAELADAVVRLVDEAGGGRFFYAGVSLSGAIGIELALRHPTRLLGLGVFDSAARIATESVWVERIAQVSAQGTPSLIGATPARWFAPDFIAREPGIASGILSDLSRVDDESYVHCSEALMTFDRTPDVGRITVPVVFVAGEFDPVTTAAEIGDLARRVPGARYVEIADTSHLAALERPTEAAEVLADLVRPDTLSERGMRTRRAVLGDAYVDAAERRITVETADFQEFITRYAWGDIWSRPGLSRRDRSIATLASLVTGAHEKEIAMHVRAALTNGLTRAEIAEVIMHTALYAGLPPANNAFSIARAVFEEGDEPDDEGAPEHG